MCGGGGGGMRGVTGDGYSSATIWVNQCNSTDM